MVLPSFPNPYLCVKLLNSMDKKAFDEALTLLIGKKIELSKLDYNQKEYDEIEEELHDMEDDFMDEYGEFIEDVLQDIHDEYCPESDVLLPIAYLANEYAPKEEEDGNITFVTKRDEGVIVEVEEGEFAPAARLVMLGRPARFVLQNPAHYKEVWRIDG